jgi:hypothetical protein
VPAMYDRQTLLSVSVSCEERDAEGPMS